MADLVTRVAQDFAYIEFPLATNSPSEMDRIKAKSAVDRVLREAAAKIRADCSMCDDGHFRRDNRNEPCDEECEYCGRPMAAILALAGKEGDDVQTT